ncbi:hypothetical protein ACTWQM_16475 [Virgibacillus sp. L01]
MLSWIIITGCVVLFSIYCLHIYNLSKNYSILMEMVIETTKTLTYQGNSESEIQRIGNLIEKLHENGIQAKKKKFKQTEIMDSVGHGDKVFRVYVPHSKLEEAKKVYNQVYDSVI